MKTKRSKLWIAAILVLVLLLICGWFFVKNQSNAGPVTNFTPEFEPEQTQETTQASTAKEIKIPGYSTIPIQANSEQVEIDLYNPEENDVHFQIDFYLTETGEKLFESKLIKPGQHLYSITLERALEPGEYPITIQYNTYSTDGAFSPKNGAAVDCILSAE